MSVSPEASSNVTAFSSADDAHYTDSMLSLVQVINNDVWARTLVSSDGNVSALLRRSISNESTLWNSGVFNRHFKSPAAFMEWTKPMSLRQGEGDVKDYEFYREQVDRSIRGAANMARYTSSVDGYDALFWVLDFYQSRDAQFVIAHNMVVSPKGTLYWFLCAVYALRLRLVAARHTGSAMTVFTQETQVCLREMVSAITHSLVALVRMLEANRS